MADSLHKVKFKCLLKMVGLSLVYNCPCICFKGLENSIFTISQEAALLVSYCIVLITASLLQPLDLQTHYCT